MGLLGYASVGLVTALLVTLVPRWLTPSLPTNVQGSVAPGWERVERQFRSLVESGAEPGGSFSVYYRGERVVNLVGGYADREAGLPWTEDTVGQFFSTTKGVAAVVIAMLVERGQLSYERPVKDYWPEFAVNGKEDITVEQLISHRAGLAWLDKPITCEDIKKNREIVSRALANQKPAWKAGSRIGYHAITLGLYQDQLVRRVDPKHRTLSQFFKEELATPLGLDFQIGLPLEQTWRCARIAPFGLLTKELFTHPERWRTIALFLNPNSELHKTIRIPEEFKKPMYNSPLVRETPLAAANGVGTTDSVAKLFGILANGGTYKEKSYLSTDSIRKLNEPLAEGTEIYFGNHVISGRGTSLRPNNDNSSLTFGTPGAGGQMGYGDPLYRLGWAYLTNFHSILLETENYLALKQAMYDTVFALEKKN